MKNENNLDDFEGNGSEDIQFQNELLKLKLRAEFGASHFGSSAPPHIENFFLKSILNVEQELAQEKLICLFDKLGRPEFKNVDEVTDEELEGEFLRLDSLLKRHHVFLTFLEEYPTREKYRFLTTEFFEIDVSDIDVPGFTMHFCYEEFDY